MALADYQQALLGIQGTPSSVRAVPRYNKPVVGYGGYISNRINQDKRISSGVARQESIGRQDKREAKAAKEEYRIALPLAIANVGLANYRANSRRVADAEQNRLAERERYKTDAIMRALVGHPEQYRQTSAVPYSSYMGPTLPHPMGYQSFNPNPIGAITSQLRQQYGGGNSAY